jgi:hypothetical protein
MRTVLISLFLSWVAVAAGQAATLSPSDLLPLLGSWKGELMCIDYSSGAETHIPATLRVDALGSRSWLIGFGYTDEPHANEQDTVYLGADGRTFDGFTVIGFERWGPDSIRMVLQAEGEDDERPSSIRKTWTVGPRSCVLRKEVLPHPPGGDAHSTFFLRHEYRFRR